MDTWRTPLGIIAAGILAIIAINSLAAVLQDLSLIFRGMDVVSGTVDAISQAISSSTAAGAQVVGEIPYISGISAFAWRLVSNLVILFLAGAAIWVIWRLLTRKNVQI